jgi:hypothetical protein
MLKASAANCKKFYPPERFTFRLLDWATSDNISSRQLTSSKFRAVMEEANPLILNYLRSGHDAMEKLCI